MSHFIFSVFAWLMVIIFVGKKFFHLWKPGLLGVGIMLIVDYFGTKYNLYIYTNVLIYIGKIPLFHILGIYGAAILYLNWLPLQWFKRALYTIYVSVLFLASEAIIYEQGGIKYPHWKLWYSYFLLVLGLLLFARISDLYRKHVSEHHEC